MKVLLIDDEKAMHLIMRRMLGKIDEVEIVGCFEDTAAAYSFLEDHEVDLVFMDINMPRESGLEFAQRLRDIGSQMKLVFVTSHTEYALSAFDVYAYDYMVKPVVQERLQHTVRRALSDLGADKSQDGDEPHSSDKVMFYCLGGMEMRNIPNGVIKWRSSKSTELFAYLLIHKGRLVSRARLIEDIYGAMPQKNAETYLNTTAYQLRKLLEAIGFKGALQSNGSHYALNLSQGHVDAFLFEEGCKQMSVVDDTNIEQALELEQLYAGDLFGERSYPWAWSEVERYSLMYLTFTRRLCAALLRRGDTSTAIHILMKLTSYNELDEETIKLLMKALAMQKNKEALTRQYLQFTAMLHQDMGVSPSFEVTSLYRRLMSEVEA